MLGSNLTSAKLQVNPADLGPIEVRIAVQGDHASVWLMSHSEVTRDALESSSTKLREMLGAQGFAQVSVDVSQRNFQERPAPSQPYVDTGAANRAATPDLQSGALSSTTRISMGALDAYA
jgi:flagellar hook-length control protein FliK